MSPYLLKGLLTVSGGESLGFTAINKLYVYRTTSKSLRLRPTRLHKATPGVHPLFVEESRLPFGTRPSTSIMRSSEIDQI